MEPDTNKYLQNPRNGLFYTKLGQPVCEECWNPIPKYRDFPTGLVSPESNKSKDEVQDGRTIHTEQEKAVCLNCYLLAFKRVYPDAELPNLSAETRVDAPVVQPIDESLL